MEENNVEVMENVTITDLDDVKEESTMTKVVGATVTVAAVYGVYSGIKNGFKFTKTKVVPFVKEKWPFGKKNSEKTPEHESSEEKADAKPEAKNSEKKNSKK